MSTFDWVLAGWFAFSSLMVITAVGEERKPLKPSTAATAVALNTTLVVGLLLSRGAFA